MNTNTLKDMLARWAVLMAEKKDWLIELDSVAGDSDLGLTMSDGFRAASEAAARKPVLRPMTSTAIIRSVS